MQDADLHIISREIKSLLGQVDLKFVKPALGLVTVSQAVMGQCQEGNPPGIGDLVVGDRREASHLRQPADQREHQVKEAAWAVATAEGVQEQEPGAFHRAVGVLLGARASI
jgi:hypothetical protein